MANSELLFEVLLGNLRLWFCHNIHNIEIMFRSHFGDEIHNSFPPVARRGLVPEACRDYKSRDVPLTLPATMMPIVRCKFFGKDLQSDSGVAQHTVFRNNHPSTY